MKVGGIVHAKFTYGSSVANSSLNVNSQGAKTITYNGSAVPAYMIKAGDELTLMYDGSYWAIIDYCDYGDLDSDYRNL